MYTAFAVTVLMRPAGSAIFGHFADWDGRRGTLTVALAGIGVSTMAQPIDTSNARPNTPRCAGEQERPALETHTTC